MSVLWRRDPSDSFIMPLLIQDVAMLFLLAFIGVSPYLKAKLFLIEVSRACRAHASGSECVLQLGFLFVTVGVFQMIAGFPRSFLRSRAAHHQGFTRDAG